MKKILLLLLLLVSINSFAQEFRVRYYDSATIWPRLRFLTLLNGTPTDSLVAHKINGQVTRLHANQLQINFSQLLNKPITLSGYGITDAYPLSGNPSGFLTSFTEIDPTVPTYAKSLTAFSVIKSSTDPLYKSIGYTPDTTVYRTTANSLSLANAQTKLNAKFDVPSGTTAQYVRGNGSLATFPSIPAQYNPTAGTGISITGSYPNQTITNTAPDQTITLTAGNRISITGTYPNFTIGYIEPIINQVSRNINTNYTIGNRQATVFYSIPVTATNPLLIGTSVGTAFLEYSTNAGGSWSTAVPTSASSSVGLSVTIQLTTGGSNLLAGVVPQNALVRIRTTTSGTATVGNATGQEIY